MFSGGDILSVGRGSYDARLSGFLQSALADVRAALETDVTGGPSAAEAAAETGTEVGRVRLNLDTVIFACGRCGDLSVLDELVDAVDRV